MTQEWFVCGVRDLPPGRSRLVVVRSREVGVFNVAGKFYALRNICPHHGAPLCLGEVGGTLLPSAPGEYIPGREGEILRCPWHAWEFDLLTGICLVDETKRVRTFEVVVRDSEVYVRA